MIATTLARLVHYSRESSSSRMQLPVVAEPPPPTCATWAQRPGRLLRLFVFAPLFRHSWHSGVNQIGLGAYLEGNGKKEKLVNYFELFKMLGCSGVAKGV